MGKLTATIENWGIANVQSDIYKAPEQGTPIIVGDMVIEAMGLKTSKCIQTSRLMKLTVEDGKVIAETRNSVYALEGMSEDFKKYLDDHNYSLSDYIK